MSSYFASRLRGHQAPAPLKHGMTVDEAINHLGAQHVLRVLNSGHAQDAGHPDSLRGRAATARLRGKTADETAFAVLTFVREADVRMACKSPEALHEAFLEGSGRAHTELVRRGLSLPQSAALQPAWL